jgi:hypothetical protein
MRSAFRLLALTALALGLLAGTASAKVKVVADDDPAQVFRMDKLFDDPWAATHSDFAFWGNYAVLGWYTATTGGVHVYDISDPASPAEIRNFPCNGNQNDPILWDRNGNGAPDPTTPRSSSRARSAAREPGRWASTTPPTFTQRTWVASPR